MYFFERSNQFRNINLVKIHFLIFFKIFFQKSFSRRVSTTESRLDLVTRTAAAAATGAADQRDQSTTQQQKRPAFDA